MMFSNRGYCPICAKDTEFVMAGQSVRESYRCNWCRSIPRQRALVYVLTLIEPGWRNLSIHESSPDSDFFAKECPRYTRSYFLEEKPLGSENNGQRCENLEQLSFPDASF